MTIDGESRVRVAGSKIVLELSIVMVRTQVQVTMNGHYCNDYCCTNS